MTRTEFLGEQKSISKDTIQEMFMRIQLKAYFDTLAEWLCEPYYKQIYKKLLDYTAVDENYYCDLWGLEEHPIPIDKNATIGDMMHTAGNMLCHHGYDLENLPFDSCNVAEDTGCKIIEEMILRPMLALADKFLNDENKKGEHDHVSEQH